MSDTYPAPAHGWTCFHCGETFTSIAKARDHTGPHSRQLELREHFATLAERANLERDHDPSLMSPDFLDGYVAGLEKAAQLIRDS